MHESELDGLALLFEFLIDSGMIAPENAHPHDSDGSRILRWQEKFSLAGCRKQIVNVAAGKSIWD